MSDFWKPDITFGGAISAAGSLYGGVSSYRSSISAARDMRYQGAIAEGESYRSAAIIREEGRKFAANQSLQYIGSGVQLMGSTLITIAQTKKYAETEAKAEEDRGRAVRYLSESQAAIREEEGRAALVSGILDGVGSFF